MSRTIQLSIPHDLSEEEVRRRIQNATGDFRARFSGSVANVEENWSGNHADFAFGVMGQRVTGRLDIDPQAVHLQIDLPWLLAALADQIRPQLEREGRRLLEHKSDEVRDA